MISHEVFVLLVRGQKINAIKLHKEQSGLFLLEAKKELDQFEQDSTPLQDLKREIEGYKKEIIARHTDNLIAFSKAKREVKKEIVEALQNLLNVS